MTSFETPASPTMNNFETLVRPELFRGFSGEYIARKLEDSGQALINDDQGVKRPFSPVSVAIRTLNEADELRACLSSIEDQIDVTEIVDEVIVVDNDSSDETQEVAKDNGAKLISLGRDEFNYPKSMNLCMQTAKNNEVLLLPGHSVLASTAGLLAVVRAFQDEQVAGIYCPPLPSHSASLTERFFGAVGNPFLLSRSEVKKASMGVMGATNAVFRKDVWENMGGFDESGRQLGGEDTEYARYALANDYIIRREPLVVAHHSHGLNIVDYYRQFRAWQEMFSDKQTVFDRDSIALRRPDIRARLQKD